VMGQEYLPGRIGVASGVTIGLSIGLGGIGAPLLGLIANAHGLKPVFELIAIFPLIALVFVQLLPARSPVAEQPGDQSAEKQETGAERRNQRVPAL
ncbi:MAG TPA: hypothetical protein VGH56_10945, partial [Solirubrobacteraceae bacterium]